MGLGTIWSQCRCDYSASRLNDSSGNRVFQNVTETYSFWVDENIFFYVPKQRSSAAISCRMLHSTTRVASWWLTLAWHRLISLLAVAGQVLPLCTSNH
jgi:hypothetical protein